MRIDIVYLVIASVVGVLFGVFLHYRRRGALSIPKALFSVVGVTFAVYYILNVFFGAGRTGWP